MQAVAGNVIPCFKFLKSAVVFKVLQRKFTPPPTVTLHPHQRTCNIAPSRVLTFNNQT